LGGKKTRRGLTPSAPAAGSDLGLTPWLVGLALILLGAGWWWLRSPGFTVRVNADRNILLVTIDTLRADALGSYGGRATTPNLDRLASRGARFHFAHAHAVVTLPSHATILTGRYPYDHGIRDNTGYRLAPGQQTAATLLRAHGFATGAFIGGFPLDHRFGLNAGFSVYDDRLDPATSAEPGDRERRADAVVTSALDWVGRQQGKWFTWVHVYDPHATYQPPPEWAARFPSDPYLGEVSWTDFALGSLFDHLASQPRPTLVIVTADHGESLGDHGELTHGVFAYEPTLRVPLIVAEIDPARAAKKGVVISDPVRHIDLLPTILEAVGAPGVADLPGASLRDLMAAGHGVDRPAYFEAMMSTVTRGWAPLRGVLVAREKFVDLPVHELYDLSKDPREAHNLAPASPGRVTVLLNTLKMFNMDPPGRARQETAETIERLRSLGYIGGGSAATKEAYTEADDPKRLIELEQIMQRAGDAYRAGRAGEAIDLYRSVIAKRPDTEDAYRKLALIYWRTGQAREAIATLESGLRNGVTQREVRNKLGQYLAEAGQAQRAIALLEHDAGDDPDSLIALGNAYQLVGRRQDALAAFRRIVEADPASGLGYENVGIAQLQAGNLPAAEEALRKALELEPGLGGAHTALGVVLASTGRKPEAIVEWKRAIEIDGSDLNALFNVTLNLAEAGRTTEARPYADRFIAGAPPSMREDVEVVRKAIR
jgi:arylsulfatase A-like enzyme/tetratricopeptide (TPR) repeat protein